MRKILSLVAGLLCVAPIVATAEGLVSKAPADAQVYFIEPQDGAVIEGPVKVVFGLENMGVAPAGVDRDNTGHHHLLIDVKDMPDMSQPLPASEHVKHFGGGQTETTLDLEPGTHTLQLLVGNYVHVPHQQPVISKKITIEVK
ncbi:MAG TPA: rod shape-determining protein RodA [Gammaproteobacteria bacterium]|nr:rod shape-determining protein RodA [Gammaproteobacteria bacterium]HBF06720.1 rod shape-determining protein RodA [Gammaproteobacteria bacterium]HCK93086.1 rod shape-determining protein RodA [Gammaproteobacteria bacterium]|tara:strand:+ start:482 stop:910 length:429 start_codon:yes stop_codon:yes gene_type:complete